MNSLVSKMDNIELSSESSIHDEDVMEASSGKEEVEPEDSDSSSLENKESEIVPLEEDIEDSHTHENSIRSSDEESESEAISKPVVNKRKTKTPQKDKWIREIHHYQKTTNLVISKLPFSRLVREIAQDVRLNYRDENEFRWTSKALEAVQTASEDFLIELLENSQLMAIHAGRSTIMEKDLHSVLKTISKMKWRWNN